ncbi:MAG: MBL fold metallo-hydrolase [Thermodesulfobacteriota bacterium]|nr:MBL fold metallo-hydrolase [Thermodesulfobacteriota bacterium]
MANSIKFVGTAGARFVVAKQLRSSGGLWLSFQDVNLYMDPGPGALVRCLASKPKLDPTKLDGILLSHKHLDHSGDINAMIEAMTEGGYRRRGVLFAPEDAMEEDPVVFRYVRSYLERVEVLQENGNYSIGNLKFSTAKRHVHSVETYGFNFHLPGLTVSYITDTKFFPDLLSLYAGELLIMNVVLLTEPQHPIEHLSIQDVKVILKNCQAKTVVLTHFGMRILQAKPWQVAERLSQETGLKVIAARDGMTLEVDGLVSK